MKPDTCEAVQYQNLGHITCIKYLCYMIMYLRQMSGFNIDNIKSSETSNMSLPTSVSLFDHNIIYPQFLRNATSDKMVITICPLLASDKVFSENL